MTTADSAPPTAPGSDGVLVVSVWKQAPDGFLGRLTATHPGDDAPTVSVVSSPDELLEVVRAWVAEIV